MKLLVYLFNKYMSADNDVNNLFDLKLLNKKRGKSKSRIRRNMTPVISQKEEKDLHQKSITEEKNLNISRQNIRHFFHFNWDDDLYEKESIKIGKYLTSTLYWVLIDSSYFSEENIENNVKKITDVYLETGSTNNSIKDELNKEKKSINKNNNIINKIDKTLLDNFKNKINSDKSHSIINYLNYDKKGKYFPSVLGYNEAKENMTHVKEHIKFYINLVNKINKKRIQKLQVKAMDIQSKYNSRNNTNKENNSIILTDDNELEESYLYEKNQESYNIRNKFWNYLYQKEKDFLIKREEKNEQETNIKDNKSEEKEDNFYINGCNICNVEDLGQNNYLYECVQCGIKVHQLCYRIKTNPDPKKWKCSKCKVLSSKEANNLECLLCPIRGGAMQRAKISKDSYFYKTIMSIRKNEEKNNPNLISYAGYINVSAYQEYPWVHLSCALWNNDVKLDIYDKKKNIRFDEDKIIKNYSNLCYVCKLRNFGPTIKCKNQNCNFFCHPECARVNDYYLEMEATDKIWKFSLYCQNHRPNRFIKYLNAVIKSFNEEIFYFSDALKYVYQLYKQFQSKEFYPLKTGANSDNNIGLFEDDDDESYDILSKKKFNNRRSKFKRNFSKKRRLISYSRNSSRHSIYIDIKNNYDLKPEKIINNAIEENNLLKNCVSKIKINNEENEKIFPLSGDNNRLIINNSQNNMNLTNETNSIKSNISRNYSNSSENNKSSTKYDSLSPIMLDQKEEFALCLIKYLRNFYMKNRIICYKQNGKYATPTEEEFDDCLMDVIREFTYDDLKEGKCKVKNMEFKGYDKPNKNYEEIYKDEDEFNSYLEKQIDNYNSKDNSKYNENKLEEINYKMNDNNKMKSGKSKKLKY